VPALVDLISFDKHKSIPPESLEKRALSTCMSRISHPEQTYRIGRILHWLTAISFIAMLILTAVSIEFASGMSEREQIYFWHMSFGVLFLNLLAFRIFWVVLFPARRVDYSNPWQAWLARINHHLMYGLMILMPLSGFLFTLADGGSVPLFNLFSLTAGEWLQNEDLGYYGEELHMLLVWPCYLLLVLHISGALSHRLKRSDYRSK
jgi:cytochrome b561